MPYGYKLVRKFRERLVSYTWRELPPKVWVHYELQREVFPAEGCGPLALFDSLNHLRAFQRTMFYHASAYDVIFYCRYTPSIERSLWYRTLYDYRRQAEFLPRGTILAASITPLRIVELADPQGTS